MKTIKLGFCQKNIFYDKPDKIKCNTLEITSKDQHLGFNIKNLNRIKDLLKGKNLSMHSQTSRVFSCNRQGLCSFNKAEIRVIEAEIILCEILGCKELIFHLDNKIVNNQEAKLLKNLLKFAKQHKIEMIYESNGRFKPEDQKFEEVCFGNLKKFPKLSYNLDIGHLNLARETGGLGIPLDEFLKKINKKVVHMHVHNNHGNDDEHLAIDKGTLDWKHVLDQLDFKNTRKIIVESRTTEDIRQTLKLLKAYFKKRGIRVE